VEGLFRTGSLGSGSVGKGDDSGSGGGSGSGSGLSVLFKTKHKHRAQAAAAAAATGAAVGAAQAATASALQQSRGSAGTAARRQILTAEWLSASELLAAAADVPASGPAAGGAGHGHSATWGGASDGAGGAADWEALAAGAEGAAARSSGPLEAEPAFEAERYVSCIDCGGGKAAPAAGSEAPAGVSGAARLPRTSDSALLRRRKAQLLDGGGSGGEGGDQAGTAAGAAEAASGNQGARFEVPPLLVIDGDGEVSASVLSPAVPSLCTWHKAPSGGGGGGGVVTAAASSPPGSGGASRRHHSRRSSAGSGGSVTLGGAGFGAAVESPTPRAGVWARPAGG
jgi:hypothetical protein